MTRDSQICEHLLTPIKTTPFSSTVSCACCVLSCSCRGKMTGRSKKGFLPPATTEAVYVMRDTTLSQELSPCNGAQLIHSMSLYSLE